MARWFLGVLGVVLLQGCTVVDNYWLGKDNTPVPGILAPLILPKAAFVPRWTVAFEKAKSKEAYLHLKPAIDGKVIYAATHEGRLKAMDKQTGKVKWEKQLNEQLVSGPVAALGRLVLATDKARIIVLHQKTGRELWRARVSGEALAAPLVIENRVLVKTIDGQLYAFDRETGEKVWVVDHGSSSLVLKAASSPVRYGNLVLAGFADGKLDAIELDTGRVVWQRGIAYASGSSEVEKLADISATPVVRGDVVYIASYQGYLVAMSLRQGDFLWNKLFSTYQNFAIDAGALYLTDNQDVLLAVGRSDGQVQWKQSALRARGVTTPVLIGDDLIVGDKQGVMHALDAAHGDFIARHTLSAPIIAAPVVDGQDVYVMTAAGRLHCFELKK